MSIFILIILHFSKLSLRTFTHRTPANWTVFAPIIYWLSIITSHFRFSVVFLLQLYNQKTVRKEEVSKLKIMHLFLFSSRNDQSVRKDHSMSSVHKYLMIRNNTLDSQWNTWLWQRHNTIQSQWELNRLQTIDYYKILYNKSVMESRKKN